MKMRIFEDAHDEDVHVEDGHLEDAHLIKRNVLMVDSPPPATYFDCIGKIFLMHGFFLRLW